MNKIILINANGDEKICLSLTDDQYRLLEYLEIQGWLEYGTEIIKMNVPDFQKI